MWYFNNDICEDLSNACSVEDGEMVIEVKHQNLANMDGAICFNHAC